MTVEVLIAAMHQSGPALADRMNVQGSAVIANQGDEYSYGEYVSGSGGTVKSITTATRGVGKNRNIALIHASGEYCLLADEDEVLSDDYVHVIADAFEGLPRADVLIFNVETTGSGLRSSRPIRRVQRGRLWNSLNYGAASIAFRRSTLIRANVWFSVLFGGGAKYSAGEDSLFLAECFQKGLRIYKRPEIIAVTDSSSSTWFEGYTEKYFMDRGAFFRAMSGRLAGPLCIQDAWRHRNRPGPLTWRQGLRLMLKGAALYADRVVVNERE